MSNRPLVSFVVIAYKQERYIREAVRSALAQTYEPLEIILSDDCSPDRTFEIMEEEAASYNGPHRVVLYRNPKNLGLIGNFNAACRRASGEIICVQAGDDRSHRQRAVVVVEHMNRSPKVDYVFSDVDIIDDQGQSGEGRMGNWVDWPKDLSLTGIVETGAYCGFLGCSAAFRSHLFERYGSLPLDVPGEDIVMCFRGAVEAGVRFIPTALVEYRIHGNMASANAERLRNERVARGRLASINEWIRVWDSSGRADARLRARLSTFQSIWQHDVECYESSRLGALTVAAKSVAEGVPPRVALGYVRRHVLSRP